MGIDHGGAHILMSYQFLDRADVLPTLQQVGSKGVPKRDGFGPPIRFTPLRMPLWRFSSTVTIVDSMEDDR